MTVLPFALVTAGPFQSFRGKSFEAVLHELVPGRVDDILSPEKHLLLQTLGKIAKVAGGKSSGSGTIHHGEHSP
ncbi:MAG: hypothetical protein ACJAVK_002758 [Akkermansiaceae bacterium]